MSDTHISDAHISRPIAGASSAALETVSLRRRVTIATLSLLAATLAILGVVVALALRERLLADLRSTMIAKARLASSLAVSLSPQQLADRLSSAQVVARVTSNGVTFTGVPRPPGGQPVGRSDARGSRSNQLAGGSRAVVPPVRAPLHPLPPPAVVDYGSVLSVTRQLGQGTKVVLSASRSSIEATVTHLEVIEVVSSLGVMVVAGLALRKVVGAALSPLDQVVEVASSIAAGNSGQRLRPLRTDTELGRMAAVFDDMVSSLEGAAGSARRSEAAMRQFVADASHELRTPVATILASAETLLRENPPRARREELEAALVRETSRLGRLVNDLLGIARLSNGTSQPSTTVDLEEVASGEVARLRALRPEARVCLDSAGAVPAWGDRDDFGRCIANLLDNAVRYSPPGTSVRVAVRPLPAGGGEVEVLTRDLGSRHLSATACSSASCASTPPAGKKAAVSASP